MELAGVYDEMTECAESEDCLGFYEALFRFTAVSLEVSNNPVLSKILSEMMPNIQRMQYLSILLKTDKMKENIAFFKTIIDCLGNHDVETGVEAMHNYVMAEKEFVLSMVGNSKYSHYIED